MQENLWKTFIIENKDLINRGEWTQVFSHLLDAQTKWDFLKLVLNQISSFPGIGLSRQDLLVLGEALADDFQESGAVKVSSLIDYAELDTTDLYDILQYAKLLNYFVFEDIETGSYYVSETLGGMTKFAKSNNIPLINLKEMNAIEH